LVNGEEVLQEYCLASTVEDSKTEE
jgi:hypothetical protein